MTIHVVAILTPKPGRVQDLLANFERVCPLVHQEPGCELYAVHTDREIVVMVERWTSRESLDGHIDGEPLALLNTLNEGVLVRPYDVWFLDAVEFGDPAKGRIPTLPSAS